MGGGLAAAPDAGIVLRFTQTSLQVVTALTVLPLAGPSKRDIEYAVAAPVEGQNRFKQILVQF